MGSRARRSGLGRVPWAVIVPLVHAAADIITYASCPRCNTRVVLYVCPRCRTLAWPNRGNGAAA